MDTVLVDTDVFSFILKKDTRAELYRPHPDRKRLALSFMTVAELHRWAVERNWGTKKLGELRAKLATYVVLHSDDATVEQYATVRNVQRVSGQCRGCVDRGRGAAVRHPAGDAQPAALRRHPGGWSSSRSR